MTHYFLIYDTAPDWRERRAQYRAEHLTLAWAAHERGELLLGGALGDTLLPAREHGEPQGALLLFAGDTPEVAARFATADPYVRHGLVTHWRVREWHTAVGAQAATPTQP